MRISDYDPRQYKYLTLDNGLRIFLVHDQHTPKSAAAITINSGQFNDPIDCQGLSHLLEHSLFLGNQQYPAPNALMTYLESSGGSINAQTGTEFTSYFMDMPTAEAHCCIEQLGAMLIKPLFTPELIDKEIHAIEAEFQMKKKDELRRLYQVHKETCNPKHPFSQFSVGNFAIFKQFSTEQLISKLTTIHQRYYQPQNTSLSIVSDKTLEELENLVINTFSLWPINQVLTKKIWPPLYKQAHLGLKINVQPIQKSHRLIVTFALPNLNKYFRTKPAFILSHIFGDEGEGSLLSTLKNLTWGTSLNAGGGIEGTNFKDFNINIQLTSEGLKKTNEIVLLVLSFVQQLKDQGIKSWQIKELAVINQMLWDFSDRAKPIDEALHLSQAMFEYKKEFLLVGDYILDQVKPEVVMSILNHFNAGNMRVKLISPCVNTNKTSQWYDTPYSTESLHIEDTQKLNTRFKFADPNPFLFRPQPLKPINLKYKYPRPIVQQEGLTIWYGQDSKFKQPKGDCFLTFDCEAVNQGIQVVTAKRLWIALLNEKLNQRYYQANLAGMHFHFYPHQGGFSLQTNGFSQNQLEFYTQLLTQVIAREDFDSGFPQLRQKQVQNLNNRLLNKPINGLFSRLAVLMQEHNYLPSDLSESMQSASLQDIYQTKTALLNKFHLEGLMYGDWTVQDANHVSATLKSFREQYSIGKPIKRAVADIKQNAVLLHSVNCQHPDNAVVVYFQMSDISLYTTTLTILAEQLIASPFFNALRAEQQLGYLVGTGYVPYNQVPGIALYVQSPHTSVNRLILAIHQFIEEIIENIEKYAQFWESIKKGLIKQVSEKDTNLSMRSQRFWLAIGNQDVHFSHSKKMIEIIKTTSLDQVKNVFIQMLSLNGTGEIILYSGQLDQLNLVSPQKIIDNPKQFKLTTPYM